jgi:hypothetical protein
MDPQLSLIPLDSPALIALHTGSLLARIERIAPQLYPCQCRVLLGELALVSFCVDRLDLALDLRWQPRQRRVRYRALRDPPAP